MRSGVETDQGHSSLSLAPSLNISASECLFVCVCVCVCVDVCACVCARVCLKNSHAQTHTCTMLHTDEQMYRQTASLSLTFSAGPPFCPLSPNSAWKRRERERERERERGGKGKRNQIFERESYSIT